MAKAKTSLTAVERRAEELDTIAAVLPMERRDELAELLTDQDVDPICSRTTPIRMASTKASSRI